MNGSRSITKRDVHFRRRLDSQRLSTDIIYGSCFLLMHLAYLSTLVFQVYNVRSRLVLQDEFCDLYLMSICEYMVLLLEMLFWYVWPKILVEPWGFREVNEPSLSLCKLELSSCNLREPEPCLFQALCLNMKNCFFYKLG